KAQWDREATRNFCECAATQVRLGNRPTQALTTAGYKGLIVDFNAKTGRKYVQKQFKNRWDDMKAIYSAWVFYKNKATGLGWVDAKQTIMADDDQWVALIVIHKPIKAFRHGPLDCLNELAIMFEKANVDGLSSLMPGVDNVS
uniref:Myb/SANT-like domain-containing protein n=1 Tax=Triticum urartu TaxID=4572 RepID=A0A8R7UTM9_TRIUA